MDQRPIGVFDSGLGGLTAVRRLEKLLPHERIVYFGDTGRVPYGNRGEEVIRRYAAQDCRFLLSQDVKMIIAACGTVSSVAPSVLSSLPVPAFGVVEPTAAAAVAASKSGRIGVIGTAATVKSGSYATAIRALSPEATVLGQECPLFVPLVENGWIAEDDPVAALTVERYLRPLGEQRIDTLILGCTHFPLLIPHIRAYLGEGVALISAGDEAAKACVTALEQADSLAPADQEGETTFYVSDKSQNFAAVANIFLGRPVAENIHRVDIHSL